MITIRIDKGGLRVTGHAGRDSPDHSLICCAVSTLVQTLALALESLTENEIEYEGEPGNAAIRWGDTDEAGKNIIDAFWLGLARLAGQYPKDITIN